jgi:hypothetical protein
MAAAAFSATLIMAKGSPAGPTRTWRCTVSDVAGAYYVFPDGNAFLTLPSDGSYYLIDLLLTPTYGTDTTNAQCFANGVNTGIVVANAANQSGTVNRQFQRFNPGFLPGATLKFVQAA